MGTFELSPLIAPTPKSESVEAVVIAKRTCKFDEMAIFHIIPIREDLDFVFLRLCPKGKLCLAWW